MTKDPENKILRKFALSEVTPLTGNGSIIKLASAKKINIDPSTEQGRILQAEIKKHPNALFFRAKAIKADEVNSNGDYFSEEELLKSYKTFEGVPFFTNHENQNIENAKGKIIFAEWNPAEKAVYTISFIDRDAYPHICRSIEEEYVSGVSMGFLSMYADITMADGSTKKISEVEVGDIVLSALGNACKVEKVYSEIMAQNMFELDLSTYHKSPLLSHDHPLLVIDAKEIKEQQKKSLKEASANKHLRRKGKTDVVVGQDGWRTYKYSPVFKETKDVVPGDYALIPSKYKLTDSEDYNTDIYYLGGAYVGDGYVALNKHKEAHNLAYYIGLHEKKELGEKLSDLLYKYSKATIIKTPYEFKNGLKISVSDRNLSDLFSSKFGRTSHLKRIYQQEFTKEQIFALISGYIDTDGTIAKNYNKTNSGDIRGSGIRGALISSCNQKLLEDIQSLLILVDVPSFITWNQRTPNKNSLVKVPTLDYSLFIPYSHLHKFDKSIKVKNISTDLDSKIKAGKTFIFTSENGQKYMACPIKKVIEKEYEEACYDLTVEKDECYIADGVAVHNCSCEYSTCSICGNVAERTDDYCFVPGTPILMHDYSIKNIEDISIGDIVIDAFGNETKVTELFSRDVSENIQSIKSKKICGELNCTSNHPFLIERRGKFVFAPAEFLDDKEILFTPIPKTHINNSWFDKFGDFTEQEKHQICKLLGYYIAEGHIIHNKDKVNIGISFAFHADEKEYRNEIKTISEGIFNKTPEIVDRTPSGSNSVELRIYNKKIVEMIESACSGLARNKILSKEIISLAPEYIKSILGTYIDGDGYSDNYGRLIITTSSRNLSYQLIFLLARLGITASLGCYEQNNGPNDRDSITHIYRVQIAMLQCEKLKDYGMKCAKAFEKAKIKLGSQTKLKNSFDHEGFIKSSAYEIEEVPYNGKVYNFETESHSYVANNISVHNCTHIKNRKGRKFTGRSKHVVTGEVKDFKDEPCFEYNFGIKFIELSAVVDPACPSCHIQGIVHNDEYLQKAANKVANKINDIYMLKEAALEKHAGKEEIEQLDGVLKTLEEIAVKLIQQRKQVEPEFASDLVNIITEMQSWFDELVAAGYGNLQSSVPGTETPDAEQAPEAQQAPESVPGTAPVPGQSPGTMPKQISEETATGTGNVSGDVTKSPVATPELPITAPIRPRANSMAIQRISDVSLDSRLEKGNKILEKVANINNSLIKSGEENMGRRRTLANKIDQKENTIKVLSNSWQEKQELFEYIKEVPSIEDDNLRLSVKKQNDTFVIVAETIDSPVISTVWEYDDLSSEQKDMIKQNPKEAAENLLTTFANSITYKKEGDSMTNINKAAGANSVNKNPDVVTQKQLDQKDLYHARTGVEQDEITQKQLNEVRTGDEADVVTQKQLDPIRTKEEADVVTQKQLEKLRKNDEADVVTQKQLDSQRTGVEQDQVTERQLDKAKAGWSRAAKRDSSLFKSASEHMNAVVNAVADTVVTSGCTPEEICDTALSLVASTEDRVTLSQAIVEPAKSEEIDYAKRLAFWTGKNLKVAAAGKQAIAEILVNNLRKVASDETINPDTVIAALDVVSEGGNSIEAISNIVDEKIALANAKIAPKASVKDEMRKALAEKVAPSSKEERDAERNTIMASLNKQVKTSGREIWTGKLNKAASKGDHLIEASFDEIGLVKGSDYKDPSFKKGIYNFTKGALAANNMKLASITNVTISGNTIQIAVQTDDGSQSVEIPIGESTGPATEETMPEGDMTGEGLENSLPPAAPAPATTTASSKKMKKVAQSPMGGGMGQTPGGVSATGAGAPVPPGAPTTDPVEALTTGEAGGEAPETEEVGAEDEIPSSSEKQMPWSICPECGASDVDVTQEESGGITGNCNGCGAKYEAMITKNVEFKIIKPKKDEMGAGSGGPEPEQPAMPEVPAIPVAAQTSLNKKTIMRMASNKEKHGHVCPACGTKHCTASVDKGGHTEYACGNCGTKVTKDLMVNAKNLDKGLLRVSWDVTPEVKNCNDCEEKAVKFASDIKVKQMLKKAAKEGDGFPTANCKERIARQYGAMTLASNGPCKGQLLTDCVCNELKRMGLRTVRHMERLASAFAEKDPMDQCVEEHSKKGVGYKEASALCACIKNKVIAEKKAEDPILAEALDNTYLAAFYEDIKNGKEKVLTASDLIALKKINDNEIKKEAALKQAEKDKALDVDIGEALPEITKKETTASMKIRRSDTPAFKLASTPTLVETIEKNDKVPRGNATMGKEGPDNIDVPMAKKVVPRGNATMGKEGPDNIDVQMKQVDIPVGDAYMGGEKAAQEGLPPTNTQIKGTVIAESVDIFVKDGKIEKIAKNLKEVDSVEHDVDVPRGNATMGNEGKDNIDVTPDPLKVPRGKAIMGEEVEIKENKADVPMGDAYMGGEKETVGKPANNDEMLTNVVKAKRELQLNRIAAARETEAIKTASWLAANGRIASDKAAFDNVVKALSAFEIGQIPTVAEQMFPAKAVKTAASSQETKEASAQGFSIPTIVQPSKINSSDDLVKNLIKHMALTKRLPQED